MKTINHRHAEAFVLGGLTLLASTLLAQVSFAQDASAATPTKNITLSLRNVPIQTALQTLFSGAGIRNTIIDNDVQGYVNVNLSDMPFNLALQNLLDSVNPKLTYDNSNGVYHVSVLRAAPPAPPVIVPTPVSPDDPGSSTTDQPKRFYRIPIDHYDAFYIARLLGAQGIVQVGVNDVIPATGSNGANGGLAGINSGVNSNRGFGGNSIFGSNGPNITSLGGSGYGSSGYGGYGSSGYGGGYGTTNTFGGYRGY